MLLTTFDSDDHVFRALEAGASGFLLKDTSPQDLLRAVRLAEAGDPMLSPGDSRRLIQRVTGERRAARQQEAASRLRALTAREREVLSAVGFGLSNAEVAASLHLSEATVKSHMSHLFIKLDATNRVQIAIAAHRAGLVD